MLKNCQINSKHMTQIPKWFKAYLEVKCLKIKVLFEQQRVLKKIVLVAWFKEWAHSEGEIMQVNSAKISRKLLSLSPVSFSKTDF